jgi:hypothetical protein
MDRLAGFVTKRYKLVLLIGAILFILCIIAAANLEVKTEIKDLMAEESPKVQSYGEVDELFVGGSSIIITVEGADRERMIRCAEEYVSGIKGNPKIMQHIRTVTFAVDTAFLKSWGLLFQNAEDLEQTRETFARLNLLPFIRSLNDSFKQTYTGGEAEEEITSLKQEHEAVAI